MSSPSTTVQTDHIAAMIAEGRHLVPPHMWSAVEGYYLRGYHPGGFLTAFLSNDLMDAISRADSDNLRAFHQWGQFLYNYAPSGSYGSPAKVAAWLDAFNRADLDQAEAA
ncbi:MAG: hypothetical protein ACOYBT_10060 [Polynucleobacter sp.]